MSLAKKTLVATLLLLPGLALPADVRTALVIGSNQYADSPLLNSVSDAHSVAKKLGGLGFEVELLTDVGADRMKAAVNRFAGRISRQPNTTAVLYFSGHGVQIQDRNILLGTDASFATLEEHSIDVQQFLAAIKPAQDSSYLVILDACREYVPQKSKRGLGVLDAPPGTLIALSTSPGRVASDGDPKDKNGLYTKHLLRNIEHPGLQIESVFKKTRAEVIAESRGEQIPWENSSLLRDLYLVGASASAPPAKLAAVDGKNPAEITPGSDGTRPPAPKHQLSDFYDALAGIRTELTVSSAQREAINSFLGATLKLSLSDEEMRFIADKPLTLGFYAKPIPQFIREHYRLPEKRGVLAFGSDGSGVAEKIGIIDGDLILEVNGQRLEPGNSRWDPLNIQQYTPGQKIAMTFLRNGQSFTREAIIERNTPAALLLKLAEEKYSTAPERARQLLEALAGQDNARALGILARAHFAGDPGFSKGFLDSMFGDQYKIAFDYARRAAALGDHYGESTEALAYGMGRGVAEDPQKAIQLLHRSADKNRLWSFGFLASRYLNGQGVAKDPEKAVFHASRGAFLGDVNSAMIIADLFSRGEGLPKDGHKAIYWYERAAELLKLYPVITPETRRALKSIELKIGLLKLTTR